MNPISKFLPSANSPFCVEGPSAITSPFLTFSPFLTIGFCIIQVPAFDLWYLIMLYSSLPVFVSTTILSALTKVTTPSFLATITIPESTAALYSIPVPTIGLSVWINGTAWRCMLAPISALCASSLSKKGIIAVATDTSCFGDTSIKSTLSLSTSSIKSLYLTFTLGFTNLLSASSGSFAWATIYLSSSSAVMYLISSVTIPFSLSTNLYGVSINPYLFIFANVESDEIRPMFGPSGDSIGHSLP